MTRPNCIALALLAWYAHVAHAWRDFQPWNEHQWCQEVVEPSWPFAYAKQTGQVAEHKGRTASNVQQLGHTCTTAGAASKCHRCEDIACGNDLRSTCAFQIQGIDWAGLPKNVPTLSDTPFAVGPAVTHRKDYGAADRVCMFLGDDSCLLPSNSVNRSTCAVRCWGDGYSPPVPTAHGWEYSRTSVQAQGLTLTLAGNASLGAGYTDGPTATAQFKEPQGVAVLGDVVWVADTGNHVIRMVNRSSGLVSTIAGQAGNPGYVNGGGSAALFSSPVGIAASRVNDTTWVYVADTMNHAIRALQSPAPGQAEWHVSTAAGHGDNMRVVLNATALSPAGFADGVGTDARFDTPQGIAISRDGARLYVADTNNHLVRRVYLTATPDAPRWSVETFAGTVRNYTVNFDYLAAHASGDELPGCVPPCQEGKLGYVDSTLRESKFYHPTDVALAADTGSGSDNVVVVDGDRVRLLVADTGVAQPWLGINSNDRVITLAGGLFDGDSDGIGEEASLDKPRGVFVEPAGHVFFTDSATCRVRRVSPAGLVAEPAHCNTRLIDIVRPSGCDMYDQAVDAKDRTVTSSYHNVLYNYDDHRVDGFQIKNCTSMSAFDAGQRSSGVTAGPRNGTLPEVLYQEDDFERHSTYRVYCGNSCAAGHAPVAGNATAGYDDSSSICGAAVHAGVLAPGAVGWITVQVQRNVYAAGVVDPRQARLAPIAASTSHGIHAHELLASKRTFTVAVYPEWTQEVQTLAGSPNAPLEELCGFQDSQPAIGSLFQRPTSIAGDLHHALTNGSWLAIADTDNHVIRGLTAVCSRPCENGGVCIATEQCQCATGWTGPDCAQPVCDGGCPGSRLCLGAGLCACPPGYTGAQCDQPLCVQRCEHGGTCVAPDTCACAPGWFDANCTTPVCSQTCGNGGNCTAADTCTCPYDWHGHDCRTPTCDQSCMHGGVCIAPHTCQCPPNWAGHDCSKPVCHQGMFRADPTPHYSDSAARPLTWPRFVPCDFHEWCNSTSEFDCQQLQRNATVIPVPLLRDVTGFKAAPPTCMLIELAVNATTHYPYVHELGGDTGYWRYTPNLPYGWGPTSTAHAWSAASAVPSDRQLARVSYELVREGVYVCANGGNCTAPDTCVCAPGWAGFDCRIPVCVNGYFNPSLQGPWYDTRFPRQGRYRCSERAVTIWENFRAPTGKFYGYVHEHPNFYSHFVDDLKGWPATHTRLPPMPPGDSVYEGWRRQGWWERVPGVAWQHGSCLPRYQRQCFGAASKAIDWRTGALTGWVLDTDAAYRPRLNFSDPQQVHAQGRWFEQGGECVDVVENGCFNGGHCAAPETCSCAAGWEGSDCSLPICWQTVADVEVSEGYPSTLLRAAGTNEGLPFPQPPPARPDDQQVTYRLCPNNGNCTLPNTCSCARGWNGTDCSQPLCAQECMHGGECVMPDTCECTQWSSSLKDQRGQPIYRRPDGSPQQTGWTGFDCTTPICVQHERWVPNSQYLPEQLAVSRADGSTFQAGCSVRTPFTPASRTRVSDRTLCYQVEWWQGHFEEPWTYTFANPASWFDEEDFSKRSAGRHRRVNHPNYVRVSSDYWIEGPVVEGEGVYACFNSGSCVGPDMCECTVGWEGYDCNVPLCSFKNYYDEIINECQNGGVCAGKDDCVCLQHVTRLNEVYPDDIDAVITGYTGSDCSIAMCAQGEFDPECVGVPPGPGGVASMGEGCYRCPNGGNCTAPDVCTCPSMWSGYDCKTPLCTMHATPEILDQLGSLDVAVVRAFQQEPCMSWKTISIDGLDYGRGNCTRPNQCTCTCFDRPWRDETGALMEEPWTDPLRRPLPRGYVYGTYDCLSGYQGYVTGDGAFQSCHLKIYEPTWVERNSLIIMLASIGTVLFLLVTFVFARYRIRHHDHYMRKERRRSHHSSDDEAEQNLPSELDSGTGGGAAAGPRKRK